MIRNVSPNHFKIVIKADKFRKLWNLLCYHYFRCGYHEKKLECFAQVCPYSSYESKHLHRRSVELRRSCIGFYSMLRTNLRFAFETFSICKTQLRLFNCIIRLVAVGLLPCATHGKVFAVCFRHTANSLCPVVQALLPWLTPLITLLHARHISLHAEHH